MLPCQDIFTSKKPEYYKSHDFYIGARLNLYDFHFEITSADVYALRYMELHCDKVRENVSTFCLINRTNYSQIIKNSVRMLQWNYDSRGLTCLCDTKEGITFFAVSQSK